MKSILVLLSASLTIGEELTCDSIKSLYQSQNTDGQSCCAGRVSLGDLKCDPLDLSLESNGVTLSPTTTAEIERTVSDMNPAAMVMGLQKLGREPSFVTHGANISSSSIFELFSMTKFINALAVMKLAEQGFVSLYDELYKHLPAMCDSYNETTHTCTAPKNYKVLVPSDAASAEKNYTYEDVEYHFTTRPAARHATVMDALNEAAGTPSAIFEAQYDVASKYSTYPFPGWNNLKTFAGYAARLEALGRTVIGIESLADRTLEEKVDDIVSIDELATDPGFFSYGYGIDMAIAACLRAYNRDKADKVTWDELLRATILDPVGMDDTFYYLRPSADSEQYERTVAMKFRTANGNNLDLPQEYGWGCDVQDSIKTAYGTEDSPNKLFSGGIGLKSTTEDYLKLLRMVVRGGRADSGTRVLRSSTVDLLKYAFTDEKKGLKSPILQVFSLRSDTHLGIGPTTATTLLTSDTPPANDMGVLEQNTIQWNGWSGGRWMLNFDTETVGVRLMNYCGGGPGSSSMGPFMSTLDALLREAMHKTV